MVYGNNTIDNMASQTQTTRCFNGTDLIIYAHPQDGGDMVDMKHTYAFCKNANENKRIPTGSILKGGSNSTTKYFATKINKCLLANSDVCYCSKSGIPQVEHKRGSRGLIRLTKVISDLDAAMNPPVSTPPIVTQPSNATTASPGTTTAPSTTSGPPGSLGPTVASESASNKKYPERPPELERSPTDKLYSTEDGEQLPLTLYGKRRGAKSVFLSCIQVGSVLKTKGLSMSFSTHWPGLVEGEHWVWFIVDVPYGNTCNPKKRTKIHTRKQKRRYLTWSGFQIIMMTSHSVVAKKYRGCPISKEVGGLYALRMHHEPSVVKFGCSFTNLKKRIASYRCFMKPSKILLKCPMPGASADTIRSEEVMLLSIANRFCERHGAAIAPLDGTTREWFKVSEPSIIDTIIKEFNARHS